MVSGNVIDGSPEDWQRETGLFLGFQFQDCKIYIIFRCYMNQDFLAIGEINSVQIEGRLGVVLEIRQFRRGCGTVKNKE